MVFSDLGSHPNSHIVLGSYFCSCLPLSSIHPLTHSFRNHPWIIMPLVCLHIYLLVEEDCVFLIVRFPVTSLVPRTNQVL